MNIRGSVACSTFFFLRNLKLVELLFIANLLISIVLLQKNEYRSLFDIVTLSNSCHPSRNLGQKSNSKCGKNLPKIMNRFPLITENPSYFWKLSISECNLVTQTKSLRACNCVDLFAQHFITFYLLHHIQ